MTTAETLAILLEIAQSAGLIWYLGQTAPYISTSRGTKDYDSATIGNFVKAKIFHVVLVDSDTDHPRLKYHFTMEGRDLLFASFKGL